MLLAMSMGGPAVTGGRDVLAVVWQEAAVVAATNKLTDFTSGGLQEPVDWATAHTKPTTVACSAFEQVKGTTVQPVLGKGKQVYLCFDVAKVRHPTPVRGPRGLPGPPG